MTTKLTVIFSLFDVHADEVTSGCGQRTCGKAGGGWWGAKQWLITRCTAMVIAAVVLVGFALPGPVWANTVAHWPGNGNLKNLASPGNDAISYASPGNLAAATYATGKPEGGAFNFTGSNYLAVADTVNAVNDIGRVMRYTGGSWNQVGGTFAALKNTTVSLAVDPNGTAYVAFKDASTGNKTTVKSCVTTAASPAWATVGSAGISAGATDFNSLTIAPDGTPYVAYSDAGSSSKIMVKRFDGSSPSWTNSTIAAASSGAASYTSLAVAPNGLIHVAYADVNDSSKAKVMRLSIVGDCNDDGVVDGSDVTYSINIRNAVLPYKKACDVNLANGAWTPDGVVDARDTTTLKNHLNGVVTLP